MPTLAVGMLFPGKARHGYASVALAPVRPLCRAAPRAQKKVLHRNAVAMRF